MRRWLEDAWWATRPGILAGLLWPAGRVVSRVAEARMGRPPRARLDVPVVCVGNPTVGGAGKTPTAILIARELAAAGRAPVFLTRGYGGRLAGPVAVDPARHGARDVGDEALLLAEVAPTVVSADRAAGGHLARAMGAGVVVMDDGFQNPGLHKDLSLLVIDGRAGVGNGLVVPAGPLRARLSPQLGRADAVVFMGAPARPLPADGQAPPTLVLDLAPRHAPDLSGRRVLAFAGIGRPEKFFRTCRDLGALVAAERPFPDHHSYAESDARALLAEAAAADLLPVTTAKDAVRLAGHGGARATLHAAATIVHVDARPAGETDALTLSTLLSRLFP